MTTKRPIRDGASIASPGAESTDSTRVSRSSGGRVVRSPSLCGVTRAVESSSTDSIVRGGGRGRKGLHPDGKRRGRQRALGEANLLRERRTFRVGVIAVVDAFVVHPPEDHALACPFEGQSNRRSLGDPVIAHGPLVGGVEGTVVTPPRGEVTGEVAGVGVDDIAVDLQLCVQLESPIQIAGRERVADVVGLEGEQHVVAVALGGHFERSS